MAYKQEPCPLCDRNMTAIDTYPGRGELYCGHCDLTIGGNDAKTPEELIALMDSSEHKRLQAENTKLRELAEILVHCMDDADGCDTCPVNGNPYDVRSEWAACDSLRELLNDVGVMVE